MNTPMTDKLLSEVAKYRKKHDNLFIDEIISNIFKGVFMVAECEQLLSELQSVKDALNTEITQDIKVEMRVPDKEQSNDGWYFLDPDNNKKEPTGLHCCRCKKKVKDTMCYTGFHSVEMHPVYPWVRKSVMGRHLIGFDCWDKIVKDGLVELKSDTEPTQNR